MPVIVSRVPPPVPPLTGLTLVSLGDTAKEYVNTLDCVKPFSVTTRLHVVSAVVLLA